MSVHKYMSFLSIILLVSFLIIFPSSTDGKPPPNAKDQGKVHHPEDKKNPVADKKKEPVAKKELPVLKAEDPKHPDQEEVAKEDQQPAEDKHLVVDPTAREDTHEEEHPKDKLEHDENDEVETFQLSRNPGCAADVPKLCPKVKTDNNFGVFVCLQDVAVRDMDEVSDLCHETLWQYKLNLTMDLRFDKAIFKMCDQTVFDSLPPSTCNTDMPADGTLVACMVEHREKVKDQKCQSFLKKMSMIVFEDFRLLKPFYQQCAKDVKKHNCGQIGGKEPPSPGENTGIIPASHSQGDVLDCLDEVLDELSPECSQQVLRAAELQSDDYHLDRPLFYACQDSRERFCADVKSGEGKVYKCLMKHIAEETMDAECTEKLKRREKMIQKDVKVDHPLWAKCGADFKTHQCENKEQVTEHGAGSNLLLCLNEKIAKGLKVSADCQAELRDYAIQIFENYEVSPVIVRDCDHEIHSYCSEIIGKKQDGSMMACLMQLATNKSLSDKCYRGVSEILKETNAGNDYKVDQPLFLACESTINELCAGKNDASMLSCLMDNTRDPKMAKECAAQVFNLQYFLSRDFTLDTALYQDCREDAKRVCHFDDFTEDSKNQLPHGVVLSCLYRHTLSDMHRDQVSASCGEHVARVMHERASSVKLMPEIEAACVADLGKFCVEKTEDGEEIACLQEHYDELDTTCKGAITEFTKEESMDFDLDRHLVDNCATMVSKFCQNELDNSDSDTVIPCLIKHKNERDMEQKCTVALEHWQILEMKDFKFSRDLVRLCEKDAGDFCPDSKSKHEALKCLSQHMVEETSAKAKDKSGRVSANCRKQVKYELMVQSENIELNSELFSACKADLKILCPSEDTHQGKAEECLRRNRKKIQGHECKKLLFDEQEEEAKDNDLDYNLMKYCARSIKKHCKHSVDEEGMMECLRALDDTELDDKCRDIVKEREEEEAESIALDPELLKNCEQDIKKFCPEPYKRFLQDDSKEDSDNGLVFECLTYALTEKKHLTKSCERYVRRREAEVVQDEDLNPQLMEACMDEIPRLCDDQPESILECLKDKQAEVKSKKCREEIKHLVVMGMEDVHVDPALEEHCSRDINIYCRNAPKKDAKVVLCLVDVHKAPNLELLPECDNFLEKRIQLYKASDVEVQFEGVADVLAAVHASPNRTNIYIVTILVLTVLFLVAAYLGRLTKRVRAEIKSR